MGFGSPLHWIVLVLVIVLLFGGGRISSLMGDVAKGIKSFKKGLSDDDDDQVAARKPAPTQIEGAADRVSQPASTASTSADQKQG